MRGPEACKRAGITYRQLDYWDRTGLVSPSIMAANGSGTQRLYSDDDLTALRIVKAIVDTGRQPSSAPRVIDAWRRNHAELIVIAGASAWCVHRHELHIALDLALEEHSSATVIQVPALETAGV